MKPTLKLSTRQQLAFTPLIQQTVRMLQLGAPQLKDEIDETLNNNPLLQHKEKIHGVKKEPQHTPNWIENLPTQVAQSLESHLLNQLNFLNLDPQIHLLAQFIITQLDDDGYLKLSAHQLMAQCSKENIHADMAALNEAIQTVQLLEPIGIASHDLASCFLQQLTLLYGKDPAQAIAIKLCSQLERLGNDNHELKKSLNISENEFSRAIRLIKQLEPFPGREYSIEPTLYIQPDIILTISKNGLRIALNSIIDCDIELNHPYIELLKNSNVKSDHNYLKKNLNNAKWWMNALAQRNKTVLLVADHMIRHQLDYFADGEISLRPLGLKHIADSLNMHVSTVSRAIKDKYLQSPRGVVLLSSLLAGRISENENILHSNQSVKVIIRDLIKNESSQTPLSDAKIVLRLKKRGIRIARRTVNKYREQMNIPASHLRRLN